MTSQTIQRRTKTFEIELNSFTLNESGSCTSEHKSRFRPAVCPKHIKPNMWSGLDDYAKEYQKNGPFLNFIAIILGTVAITLQSLIQQEFKVQSDAFEKFDPNFKHIPEVKSLYIGDVGPGIWCGSVFIIAGILGLFEYFLEKFQKRPFKNLSRAFYLCSLLSIFLIFPVIINGGIAIYHRYYIEHRELSGYCFMNKEQTDHRYVLPVDKRNCDIITDLHAMQMAFCVLQLMVAATLMRVVHEPAWCN